MMEMDETKAGETAKERYKPFIAEKGDGVRMERTDGSTRRTSALRFLWPLLDLGLAKPFPHRKSQLQASTVV